MAAVYIRFWLVYAKAWTSVSRALLWGGDAARWLFHRLADRAMHLSFAGLYRAERVAHEELGVELHAFARGEASSQTKGARPCESAPPADADESASVLMDPSSHGPKAPVK